GVSILIIILVTIVAFRLVKFATKRMKKLISKRSARGSGTPDPEAEKRANTLMGILKSIMRVIIWLIFIMLLLSKFGVNIGPIIASAGILGLAIGFGAQELVRDFITGFFILLEDQLRTGDIAIINGTAGLVEDIELRTITLRDFSGTVHIFQNGKISTLANMTKEWSAIVLDIGVAYKEDIDHVMQIMKEVGEDLGNDEEFGAKMIEPIEIFGLNEFGDSALVVKARIKTKPGEQWATGREYRRRLKIAFDKQNIEIPFPHTTVYWGEEITPLTLNMENTEK
ncbi:MAG TPA: mechanosensitive ion channel family protein, partial [Bacteroidales bacterium]|nr:mechanosensitive ion channel family protein [Bacteroidales bacterium]